MKQTNLNKAFETLGDDAIYTGSIYNKAKLVVAYLKDHPLMIMKLIKIDKYGVVMTAFDATDSAKDSSEQIERQYWELIITAYKMFMPYIQTKFGEYLDSRSNISMHREAA